MRIGANDRFWVVTNPTADSTLADIFFDCTLARLELQFNGGLTAADNPTLYTSEPDALRDAEARLAARNIDA